MDLYKVTVHKDDSWNLMNELGKLNSLHFIDLNRNANAYDLPYITQVREADESLRQIEYIEKTYERFGIEMKPCVNINNFFDKISSTGVEMGKAQ